MAQPIRSICGIFTNNESCSLANRSCSVSEVETMSKMDCVMGPPYHVMMETPDPNFIPIGLGCKSAWFKKYPG
jgi:hypothetical protein